MQKRIVQMGKKQDEAFEGLKIRLAMTPVLAYPNWNKEFHVHVDASNYAIGATLAQTGSHSLDHPIYFASRLLSKAEQNYTTTERETLGMVYAMQKFRHYLLATPCSMSTIRLINLSFKEESVAGYFCCRSLPSRSLYGLRRNM